MKNDKVTDKSYKLKYMDDAVQNINNKISQIIKTQGSILYWNVRNSKQLKQLKTDINIYAHKCFLWYNQDSHITRIVYTKSPGESGKLTWKNRNINKYTIEHQNKTKFKVLWYNEGPQTKKGVTYPTTMAVPELLMIKRNVNIVELNPL